MTTWQEAMWTELDAMAPVDRVVATGRWITEMTQDLLPELGNRRRGAILEALQEADMDPTKLAEMIGARPGTIKRLVQEARQRENENLR